MRGAVSEALARTAGSAQRLGGVEAARSANDRLIGIWLAVTAAMILALVVIGGITRLTESGLSITEWRPVDGVLPPLGAAAWQAEFDRYKQIPEYAQVHFAMTLDEFKQIYFWEYLHRLWARLIGLVALVPPLAFLATGRLRRGEIGRYLAVPVLVGLQGVLGWYMVKSGLSVRTSVSQYRLTAHLGLAVLIYGYVVWLAASRLSTDAAPVPAALRRWRGVAGGLVALVFTTVLAGGFMAGLKAGLTYNTFPLMDGRLIPDGYFMQAPWWLNPFENIAAVQFDHRCLAIATLIAAIALWAGLRRAAPARVRGPLDLLLALALVQVGLGIATLLLVVPIPLAASHQAGAILLFTAALLTRHGLSDRP
jgi:cytochrome c oxidase assembly protein subunit 15